MVKTELSSHTDDLVRRARHECQAFSQLYELYYERILRYCVRRLFVQEAAEDVTSDVFLAVARGIQVFPGDTEQAFRYWLYAIASNQANAYLRKKLRRKKLLNRAAYSLEIHQIHQEHPEDIEWPVLYQAIAQLKPEHQTIITLRFFEKMSHKQVAEILCLKEITVRAKQGRALGKLRKILRHMDLGDVNHV